MENQGLLNPDAAPELHLSPTVGDPKQEDFSGFQLHVSPVSGVPSIGIWFSVILAGIALFIAVIALAKRRKA